MCGHRTESKIGVVRHLYLPEEGSRVKVDIHFQQSALCVPVFRMQVHQPQLRKRGETMIINRVLRCVLAAVLVGITAVAIMEPAYADTRCSHYAQVPYVSGSVIYAYGEASCSVWENRGVGSRLREDLYLRPDRTVAEVYWEGSSNFHSRTASKSAVYDNDGDTQEYFTYFWTYDSVYGTTGINSAQLASHWEA